MSLLVNTTVSLTMFGRPFHARVCERVAGGWVLYAGGARAFFSDSEIESLRPVTICDECGEETEFPERVQKAGYPRPVIVCEQC